MDAHLTLNRRDLPVTRETIASAVYSTGMALLVTCSVILAWRRAGGALTTPLSAGSLLLSATIVSAATLGTLQAARIWQRRISKRRHIALVASVLAATGLITTTLSLPGTSSWGMAALWLPTLLALATHTLLVTWQDETTRVATRTRPQSSSKTNSPKRVFRVDQAHTAPVPAPHFPPQNVTQQLTRSSTEDGRDECQGWIRANFEEGQRQQVVHLAFCPPFSTLPELTTSLADGQSVEVKHAQLMPYGARVELKRDRSAKEPSVALLRFSAVEVRAAG